jgi:heat shock protein HtpX
MAENRAVHDDLIDSGRRRLVVVSILGILLLALALTFVIAPFAYAVGALGTLLRGSGSYGWSLVGITFGAAFLLAFVVSALGFLWVYRRAERSVLSPMQMFPRPFSAGSAAVVPRDPAAEHRRVQNVLEGLSIASGVFPPPSCAVITDAAPNCLTIGRRKESAWIVVTTGLVESMSRDELEAVLAYEIGRVAAYEVSLDTAVYACTARVFEVWALPFADGDFDIDNVVFLPVTLLTTPLALGGAVLRRYVLRSRARLSDGLAVRYCRNPAALLSALRKIDADPRTVRAADLDAAHLWLQYPHTRASSFFFGSRKILRERIARLEVLAGPASVSSA